MSFHYTLLTQSIYLNRGNTFFLNQPQPSINNIRRRLKVRIEDVIDTSTIVQQVLFKPTLSIQVLISKLLVILRKFSVNFM